MIKDKLVQILANCSGVFSEPETREVMEFIDVDEYGLALDTLCAIYSEENKLLTQEQHKLIKEVGLEMKMSPDLWEELVK